MGLFSPASVGPSAPGTASLPLVRVSLTGAGFLLHQIRHTIGLALAEVRGDSYEGSFLAALSLPRFLPLPLGAPTTLLLRSPHFGAGSRLAIDEAGLHPGSASASSSSSSAVAAAGRDGRLQPGVDPGLGPVSASSSGRQPGVLEADVAAGTSLSMPRAPEPPGEGADAWGMEAGNSGEREQEGLPGKEASRPRRWGPAPQAPGRGDRSGEIPWGQRQLL